MSTSRLDAVMAECDRRGLCRYCAGPGSRGAPDHDCLDHRPDYAEMVSVDELERLFGIVPGRRGSEA